MDLRLLQINVKGLQNNIINLANLHAVHDFDILRRNET